MSFGTRMRIEADNNQKKKTVISDDSLIYSKREERSTREKFKDLDRKEKWQFFIPCCLVAVGPIRL